MRTRRLVLTLLAVGLISAVCWVSVWAWGNAWRDVGGTRMTFAGGYAPGFVNNYTMRVTGPKLVCIDIDSNTIHACDTNLANSGPGAACPQTPATENFTAQCDPFVQVVCAPTGGPWVADDLVYVPSRNFAGAGAKFGINLPAAAPNAPIYPTWPWHFDADPFLCFYVPTSTSVSTCAIQVGGSANYAGGPSGCNYYMMTITSTPWKNSGLLTPVGVGNW